MIPQRIASRCSLVGYAARVIALVLLACSTLVIHAGKIPAGFADRFADVNGVHLHYLIGGKGSPVVLLHGYAETSHMWGPILPQLAENHTVIVPDLRGAGDSSKPDSGYDKKTMAKDIHDLVVSLKFNRASVAGHDIGLMVAYAFAAQFPQETDRLVLMDAFLPGIGKWKDVWLSETWHFHFYGDVPLALVKGRERTYFEHFWNDFAADPKHSLSEADRELYAKAYAQPGGMRAGFSYFSSMKQDAKDFAELGATPLPMPVLVLAGEKAGGDFLLEQTKLVATNVQGQVVTGSGHWLMEEAPQVTIPALLAFLNQKFAMTSGLRLTAAEIEAIPPKEAGAGTSGASGIETRVLRGDPAQPRPYTIELTVPTRTKIEAHSHPDDRTVTVISGTWALGYGTRFAEQDLKDLPPGSFYTEPSNSPHFAHTGNTPAVVQISGFGPSGTHYE